MLIIDDLVKSLWPVKDDGESSQAFQWRQTASLCIFLLGGSQMFSSIAYWGLAPFVFAGFATQTSVETLVNSTNAIQVLQLERNIRELKNDVCNAQIQGNLAALKLAGDALGRAKSEYYAVKHIWPQEPGCDQLVLSK